MTLQRKTPLKKKRDTPRRVPLFTCAIRACNNPPKHFQWCGKHAIKEADKLFARVIKLRDRACLACGRTDWPECAHVESRRYFAVRWSEANAVQLDRDCHMRFTMDPIAWHDWCVAHFGEEAFEANRARARAGGMPDVGWVITELRARLKDLEAAA